MFLFIKTAIMLTMFTFLIYTDDSRSHLNYTQETQRTLHTSNIIKEKLGTSIGFLLLQDDLIAWSLCNIRYSHQQT